MLRPYIQLFTSEMELIILNVDGPLIKVSIADGRMLILQFMGILSFFIVAIMKPFKRAGGTHDIEC